MLVATPQPTLYRFRKVSTAANLPPLFFFPSQFSQIFAGDGDRCGANNGRAWFPIPSYHLFFAKRVRLPSSFFFPLVLLRRVWLGERRGFLYEVLALRRRQAPSLGTAVCSRWLLGYTVHDSTEVEDCYSKIYCTLHRVKKPRSV